MDFQHPALMAEIGTRARAAAAELAYASSERKYAALIGAADEIWNRRQAILDANCEDLIYGAEKGLTPALMDRLSLDQLADPGPLAARAGRRTSERLWAVPSPAGGRRRSVASVTVPAGGRWRARLRR